MLDIKTIRFIELLRNLSYEAADGIIPFSEYNWRSEGNPILYDDRNCIKEEELSGSMRKYYPIVCNKCVDDIHHDIISYLDADAYGLNISDFNISVCIEDFGDDIYKDVEIVVNPGTEDSEIIVINKDSEWYIPC